MKFNRLAIGAAFTVAGLLPTVQGAWADCVGALSQSNVWYFHAIEAGLGAAAIKCVATFKTNGNFTAPCTIFNVGTDAAHSVNASGKLALSAACVLGGSITLSGEDEPIIIKNGHVNGNFGAGIGIQGTNSKTQVLHFTLVKQ